MLFLGGIALIAFFWSVKSGQCDDKDSAAEQVLLDDGLDEDRNA
ncbi:cbb3-type cytochrome oxidase assembly protein CcoS [Hyphococcus flavus]